MTKTFRNLDPDKQKQIINAALQEFTEKGFDLASTNQIVKSAGIGKGMLFYYFTSKKDLYFYLIDYCLEITERKYLSLIDTEERDFFERMKQISRVKLEFLGKHPDSMNFMAAILLKNFDEIDEHLKSRIIALQEKAHSKIYENVDYTLFRGDIDAKKALQLINWTLRGYEEDLKIRLRNENAVLMDYKAYFDEYYDYLDILKTSFYTKEDSK